MANKVVKTFEEFISFEIENSEVHIHVEPKGSEETDKPEIESGDEVMVNMPPMNLSSVDSTEYDNEMDSEIDETPESDKDEDEE
jgi:hypothetical protein